MFGEYTHPVLECQRGPPATGDKAVPYPVRSARADGQGRPPHPHPSTPHATSPYYVASKVRSSTPDSHSHGSDLTHMVTISPRSSRRGAATSLQWLCVVFTLMAGQAAATTVARFGLADLTNNAASIFVGTCVQAEVESVGGRIYTRYLFTVSEIIKGESPEQARIQVTLPGGEMDGRSQYVTGVPRFEPGSETVLFLTAENAAGHAWPVGLGQGKFDVRRDDGIDPGHARVYRQLSGVNLLDTTLSTTTKVTTDPAAVPWLAGGMALDDFLSSVRSSMQSDAGAGDADEPRR